MNKKFIFCMAAGVFAVASVMSFNVSNANGVDNVSLDEIVVMAIAQEEINGGMLPEVKVYGYQLESVIKLSEGRYVSEREYEELQKNEWYTFLHMNSRLAECTLSFCDYFDLTGDPSFGYVPDGRGGVQWSQTDDCDGQPNAC